MRRLPFHGLAKAAMGLALGCGEAPAEPGALRPAGAGADGSGESQVALDSQPRPDGGGAGGQRNEAGAGGMDSLLPDAGGVAVGGAGSKEPPVEGGPSYAVTGCTESVLTGCEYLYIAAFDEATEFCIQLTLDACTDYGNGLGAEVPLSWRLGSGSVSVRSGECEPGEFYVDSVSVTSARGDLTWNQETRQPSDVVIDLTLETSRLSLNAERIPDSLPFSSTALVGPLAPCDD